MAEQPPPTDPTDPTPTFDFTSGSERVVLAKVIPTVEWARARIVTRIHGAPFAGSSDGEDGSPAVRIELIVKE